MKKALLIGCALALLGTFAFAEGTSEYPTRDITNVLVWAAGGGTDLANRLVMAEMAKDLKVNVSVVNVTGGVGGSVGMLEAWNKGNDGYTLAGISESCVTAGVQGGWDKRVNVWDYFIIGGSPDLVSVNPGAPYQNIKDLVEAAKANPKGIRAGASASGSIHHLNLLAFEKGAGIQLNFIPYDGSAPAQNAAMTGEVSVVITSAQEQSELIKAGKLRPLAMLVPSAFTLGDKKIPSAFEPYPGLSKYLPLQQQIGFAIRRDAPESVKKVLRRAFATAMKSEPVVKFGQERYFELTGLTGDEANKIFDKLESQFGWNLWELGAAKVDPSTLGIPKP
jgi:tripartite-type tricarboxylate transporter receptor subunit TctC